MTLTAYFFWEITHSEKRTYIYVQKSRFKGPFDRQHGKRVQTLLLSKRQRIYHIYLSF